MIDVWLSGCLAVWLFGYLPLSAKERPSREELVEMGRRNESINNQWTDDSARM
jgi:hypothetical protein